MKKANTAKTFRPVSEESVCEYMKMITLKNLYEALKYDRYVAKVPEDLSERARIPIQRMLEIV